MIAFSRPSLAKQRLGNVRWKLRAGTAEELKLGLSYHGAALSLDV